MIKNLIKGDLVFWGGGEDPHKKIKCYLSGVVGFLVFYPHSFTNDEKKITTWSLFIYSEIKVSQP